MDGGDPLRRHVKPLGLRVLVRIEKSEDRTTGGLFLPAGAKDAIAEADYGEVIEVARAEADDEEGFGANVSGIPEGAKVLFPKGKGLTVPWDDQLRVVNVEHISAIVDEIESDDVH
ncbi:MAG: co-chaperone GroES family protein [Myxococcota bacterium]